MYGIKEDLHWMPVAEHKAKNFVDYLVSHPDYPRGRSKVAYKSGQAQGWRCSVKKEILNPQPTLVAPMPKGASINSEANG